MLHRRPWPAVALAVVSLAVAAQPAGAAAAARHRTASATAGHGRRDCSIGTSLDRARSYPVRRLPYHLSGRLAIRMDDGTELVAGPGDVTSLPSGHDGWVVGDEPAIVIDWFGASAYAKPV